MIRWLCIIAGALFIGWSHCHTDEIPIVLGFVLNLGTILGAAFPRQPWLTGLLIGIPLFFTETLVHFTLISAPYPPSAGLPWVALVGLIPGLAGAYLGYAVRKSM